MKFGKLDISTLENWLWEAACSIRGPVDAPKYKDYIIPLIFYKRLCDVFEDEIKKLAEEFGWRGIEGFSKIITIEEARKNDYNLSPSRYVSADEKEEIQPVEEERVEVDKELRDILNKIGFGV